MTEHHPLGMPGRARGVNQGCQIIPCRTRRLQAPFPLFIGGDAGQALPVTAKRHKPAIILLQLPCLLPFLDKDQRDLRIIEHIMHRLCRIGKIGRYGDRAQTQNGKISNKPFRAVMTENAHPVARPDILGFQPGRYPQYRLHHPCTGPLFPRAIGLSETQQRLVHPFRWCMQQ